MNDIIPTVWQIKPLTYSPLGKQLVFVSVLYVSVSFWMLIGLNKPPLNCYCFYFLLYCMDKYWPVTEQMSGRSFSTFPCTVKQSYSYSLTMPFRWTFHLSENTSVCRDRLIEQSGGLTFFCLIYLLLFFGRDKGMMGSVSRLTPREINDKKTTGNNLKTYQKMIRVGF